MCKPLTANHFPLTKSPLIEGQPGWYDPSPCVGDIPLAYSKTMAATFLLVSVSIDCIFFIFASSTYSAFIMSMSWMS